MSTRRPTMSLEGTLEMIDLTHASDEEAMSTVLRELRARRERRPRGRTGPAVMIELGRADGARGEPAGDASDAEPRAPRRGRRHDHGSAGPDAAPFSFADLGAVLREMAGARADAPEPETTQAREPGLEEGEERAEVEQILTRRTLIMEEDGAGKMMAAAVVGFGLGAAAMFLARNFRYVAPPPSRPQRPRKPRLSPDEAAWQAQLDEIARRYADPGDEEEDDDEEASSPGE